MCDTLRDLEEEHQALASVASLLTVNEPVCLVVCTTTCMNGPRWDVLVQTYMLLHIKLLQMWTITLTPLRMTKKPDSLNKILQPYSIQWLRCICGRLLNTKGQ